jgi:hypothetical protein
VTRALSVALTLLAVVGTAHVATAQTSRLVVRAYNRVGIPLERLHGAGDIVRNVLNAAGIEVEWKECRTPRGPSARLRTSCEHALAPVEIAIRLEAAPRTLTDTSVLGYSQLDARAARGVLGTIFVDRVVTLARDSGTVVDEVMGRAIAHEIGHLLLGGTDHPAVGLMRSNWSRGRGAAAPAEWLFLPTEAERMRAALIRAEVAAHQVRGRRPSPN